MNTEITSSTSLVGFQDLNPKAIFHPISTPEHFNFKLLLTFLNRSDLESLFVVTSDAVIKPYKIENGRYVVTITEESGRMGFYCEPEASSVHLEAIKNDINEWFDLERDLSPFYEMAANGPLAQLTEKYRGLRLVGINSLYEALAWSIIGQQINLRFAYQMKRALVTKYGESISLNGKHHYLFPEPKTIASLEMEDLKAIQFSRQKASYLIGISHVLQEREWLKANLEHMTSQEIRERLLKLKGVGDWTADYVLLKCFKQTDAIPLSDAGLLNATRMLLDLPGKPSISEMINISEDWAPWRGYATFYLWHSLIPTT